MGTCAACGDDFPETAILECPDCEGSYCRHDYHGHDCAPAAPEASPSGVEGSDGEETIEGTTSTSDSSGNALVGFGYLLTMLAASGGLLFLGLEINAVLFGAQGLDAIQAVMHLVVAAALFSFATLVLVASYIGSRA